MKKVFVLIMTIILALSMVSCNIQEFINGWGTTSTTSGEVTSTTTAPELEYITLEELVESIDYEFVTLGFYTNNGLYRYPGEEIEDLDYFLNTFIKNKNQMMTDDNEYVNQKSNEVYKHISNSRVLAEWFICNINFWGYSEYWGDVVPFAGMCIYYNGTVEFWIDDENTYSRYISVESGAIDWDMILDEYFYYFDVRGLEI